MHGPIPCPPRHGGVPQPGRRWPETNEIETAKIIVRLKTIDSRNKSHLAIRISLLSLLLIIIVIINHYRYYCVLHVDRPMFPSHRPRALRSEIRRDTTSAAANVIELLAERRHKPCQGRCGAERGGGGGDSKGTTARDTCKTQTYIHTCV